MAHQDAYQVALQTPIPAINMPLQESVQPRVNVTFTAKIGPSDTAYATYFLAPMRDEEAALGVSHPSGTRMILQTSSGVAPGLVLRVAV